jgi:hypothetical protein
MSAGRASNATPAFASSMCRRGEALASTIFWESATCAIMRRIE